MNFKIRIEKSMILSLLFLLLLLAYFFVIVIIFMIIKGIGIDETIAAGAIGAMGSLVGGLFTLIGVKWTIDKQKKEKFLDSFPRRVYNLTEISTIIWEVHQMFNQLDTEGTEKSILINIQKLVILASEENGETFKRIIDLEDYVKVALRRIYEAKYKKEITAYYEFIDVIKDEILEFSKYIDSRKKDLNKLHNSHF